MMRLDTLTFSSYFYLLSACPNNTIIQKQSLFIKLSFKNRVLEIKQKSEVNDKLEQYNSIKIFPIFGIYA